MRVASCAAHLHAEDRHRHQRMQRDVLGDIERERGLAHRGTPGDDDQLARLQARGLGVEVVEAGRHPGDVGGIVAVVEVIDALQHAREHRLDLLQPHAVPGAGLADLENARLGLVQELPHLLAARAERALGDLGGDLGEAPLHRALAHQLRVAPDVERARGVLRQRPEVGGAPGLVPVLARLDRFRHRDHVGGSAGLDQLRDVAPDAAVVVPVEVPGRDQVGDAVECLVVEEQPAEERLLRLDRVRRNLER